MSKIITEIDANTVVSIIYKAEEVVCKNKCDAQNNYSARTKSGAQLVLYKWCQIGVPVWEGSHTTT